MAGADKDRDMTAREQGTRKTKTLSGDPAGPKPNLRPIKSAEAVAVALTYDSDKAGADQAPTVAAGGRGAIAEQILEMAFQLGIPVREDADLAQLLSTIDIDSEIPLEAFAAVAEILIYVYRANGMLPDYLAAADTAIKHAKEGAPS